MKAIIAIDSFKGCLTSMEAGEAALEAFTEGEAEIIPVSDGGEGFSTILTESLGGTFGTAVCHDLSDGQSKRGTAWQTAQPSSKPRLPVDWGFCVKMNSILSRQLHTAPAN